MSEAQAVKDYLLRRMNENYKYAFEAKARLATLEQKNTRLRSALDGLQRAIVRGDLAHGMEDELAQADAALKEIA